MTVQSDTFLLPNGVSDILPPYSDAQLDMENILLATFRGFGYLNVHPPLIEFEESLLLGSGNHSANKMFRIMDPSTHQMMGIRTDMTLQVGRIAGVRMKNYARPLRLMYGGEVVLTHADSTRTHRTFKQYGAELIGMDNACSDAESIHLSIVALQHIGIKNISVDICLPLLPVLLCNAIGIEFSTIRPLLEKKDISAIKKLPGKASTIFIDLLSSAGCAQKSLTLMQKISLPSHAKHLLHRVKDVVDILYDTVEDSVGITIDACETKGFTFQTGIGFTVFSKDIATELGRGGRYVLHKSEEPSVGFSLYSDSLLKVLHKSHKRQMERIYAPYGTPYSRVQSLRKKGKSVTCGFLQEYDVKKTAKDLKCTHFINKENIEVI